MYLNSSFTYKHYINELNTKTPKIPTTETILSMIDQERKVSLILRLKYSLNSQKPGSFTCENIKLPEPIASTISSGLAPVCITKGAIIPAVVSPATVAEPTHIRMIAATNHPIIKGLKGKSLSIVAISLLTPLSTKICFNAPAPPVINKIIDTSLTAWV